jgi:hypothetical protein
MMDRRPTAAPLTGDNCKSCGRMIARIVQPRQGDDPMRGIVGLTESCCKPADMEPADASAHLPPLGPAERRPPLRRDCSRDWPPPVSQHPAEGVKEVLGAIIHSPGPLDRIGARHLVDI